MSGNGLGGIFNRLSSGMIALSLGLGVYANPARAEAPVILAETEHARGVAALQEKLNGVSSFYVIDRDTIRASVANAGKAQDQAQAAYALGVLMDIRAGLNVPGDVLSDVVARKGLSGVLAESADPRPVRAVATGVEGKRDICFVLPSDPDESVNDAMARMVGLTRENFGDLARYGLKPPLDRQEISLFTLYRQVAMCLMPETSFQDVQGQHALEMETDITALLLLARYEAVTGLAEKLMPLRTLQSFYGVKADPAQAAFFTVPGLAAAARYIASRGDELKNSGPQEIVRLGARLAEHRKLAPEQLKAIQAQAMTQNYAAFARHMRLSDPALAAHAAFLQGVAGIVERGEATLRRPEYSCGSAPEQPACLAASVKPPPAEPSSYIRDFIDDAVKREGEGVFPALHLLTTLQDRLRRDLDDPHPHVQSHASAALKALAQSMPAILSLR